VCRYGIVLALIIIGLGPLSASLFKSGTTAPWVAPFYLSALPVTTPPVGQQRLWCWRGWRVRYWFSIPRGAAAQRPPLVLVHGFGANLNQWRRNLATLSQHQPVYALDLLGFGDGDKAAAAYGTPLWSAQVGDFLTQVVGRPGVLVGHSLGALVALSTALQQPAQVQRLVLLTLPLTADREDLVPPWVDALGRRAEAATATPLLLRPLFRLVRQPWFLRRVLRQVYLHPHLVDDELVTIFALPPRQRGAARTLCYLVNARSDPAFSPSVRQQVGQLSQPTLLLWGEADRVVPPRWGPQLAALNPRVELQLIPQAGHCWYDEQPEGFHDALAQWLEGPVMADD